MKPDKQPSLFNKIIRYIQSKIQERQFSKLRYKFYQSFIKQGDLVFDIGANMGNRVENFVQIGAKVVAIEPNPMCVAALKKKFSDKIEIVNKGVGNASGHLQFYRSNIHVLSSFSESWIEKVGKGGRFPGATWTKAEMIPICTLDELVLKYGIPSFIKIDVEGFETFVLEGLNSPFHVLSFEYAVPEAKNNLIHCIEILQSKFKNLLFNYASGEHMDLKLESWTEASAFLDVVNTANFEHSLFGDIYVKQSTGENIKDKPRN